MSTNAGRKTLLLIQFSKRKFNKIIRAFPFGSGFPLQSFADGKRISASIPNAKNSGVRSSRIYWTHPANAQARLMQWLTHNANPFTASMVLPPFLTVILFVAMLPMLLAHCLFRFAAQPKSQANPSIATKSRYTPTTTTVSLMPV